MQGVVVWEFSAAAEEEGSWVEPAVAGVELVVDVEVADVDPKYVQWKGQVVEKADEGEVVEKEAAEGEVVEKAD